MTNLTLVSGDKPEPKIISKENKEKAIKETEEFLEKMRGLGFIISLSYVGDGICEGTTENRIIAASGKIDNSEAISRLMLVDSVFNQLYSLVDFSGDLKQLLEVIKTKVIRDGLKKAGEIQ